MENQFMAFFNLDSRTHLICFNRTLVNENNRIAPLGNWWFIEILQGLYYGGRWSERGKRGEELNDDWEGEGGGISAQGKGGDNDSWWEWTRVKSCTTTNQFYRAQQIISGKGESNNGKQEFFLKTPGEEFFDRETVKKNRRMKMFFLNWFPIFFRFPVDFQDRTKSVRNSSSWFFTINEIQYIITKQKLDDFDKYILYTKMLYLPWKL